MLIFSFGVAEHPDSVNSVAVMRMEDTQTGESQRVTLTAKGWGVRLQCVASIRALAPLRAALGTTPAQVRVSQEMYDAAHGKHVDDDAVDSAASLVAFLEKTNWELVPSGLDVHLVALAEAELDLSLEDLLPKAPFLTDEDLLWAKENSATVVYTDGSCDTDLFVGTWSWFVSQDQRASGKVPHLATSLASERYAVAQALKSIPGPVLVVADSWDIDSTDDIYTAAQNVEDDFSALLEARGDDLRFVWIKGHDTCLGNIVADRLAGQQLAHARKGLGDKKARKAHTAKLDKLMHDTAAHREKQQAMHKWFAERCREIVHTEHPNWKDLSSLDRTLLGREITLRARKEYSLLNQQ